VLASSRLPGPALQALLGRWPVVLFNREADGFPSVVTDSADGSRQVVEHLAALGHRRIAYLAGPVDAWVDGQRWQALSRHAARMGVEIARLGPFAPTVEHGSAAADVALAGAATALVAFNDLLAIGVLRRLERLGVRVPEQVSVVGFDDIFGADFCSPTLTTLAERTEDAGARAVEAVVHQAVVRAVEPPTRVLPTRLVVRDSTGPVPSWRAGPVPR
jgi:LacI family transcriptional regulator